MEDIDLMAGIWLERPVKGGVVPSTLYCVVVEQLRRSLVSDRHWYERPNRPNAFTPGSCKNYLLLLISIAYLQVASYIIGTSGQRSSNFLDCLELTTTYTHIRFSTFHLFLSLPYLI